MNPTTPDTIMGIDRTSQAQDAHNPVLHKSAERLRLAMMVINDGLWDWDLATNEVYFDPRYYLMAGYAADEFPHRLEEFQQRIHPDHFAQVMAEAQQHLNGQSERFEIEFRFRKKDGDYLWVLGKGQIVERDAQGRPLRFIGTHSDITRRKRAEEALRESKERYETLREISPVGVWEITPDRRTLFMNPAMRTLLELDSGADLRERESDSFFTPEGLEVMRTHHAKRPQGIRSSYEVELIGSRGGKRTVIVSGAPLFSGEGKLTSLIGWFTDITERKRAEEALRASEERLCETARIAQVGGWEIDLEGNTLAWTEETFHIHELASDQPPGVAEAIAFYHPDDQPQVRAAVQCAMEGGPAFDFEARLITAKKNLRWVRAMGRVSYRAGHPIGIHGMVQDITERKRAEEALRESEERLELVLEGGQLGYWDWNIQTGTVHRNARWAEMLGYTLQEIERNVKQWSDLQHPDDQSAAWQSISDHLEGRTSAHRIEYRMRTKDGQYKWILDQARIVERDAQGRPLRMSGTHIDITERKRIEAELQQRLAELQRWYEVMLDREGRVLELKREADALRQRLGEPPLYAVELADDLSATLPAPGTRP